MSDQERNAEFGDAEWSHTLGVSAIVRFRKDIIGHPAGTLAMVVAQATNGRNRMSVMVPGDPLAYTPLVTDLEFVQGIEPQRWWKRQHRPQSGSFDPEAEK